VIRIILASLIALGGVAAVGAQSHERAQAAYFRGDYDEAMRLMQPLAERGDRHSQYLIGFMYERGEGVSKDYKEAAKWYALAADNGHPFAQNNLGVLHKYGRGVSKDFVQAYKWFNLAASGYLPAEFGHRERAILNQQSVSAEMTGEQISEARELAEEFRSANENVFEDRPPKIR